MTQNGVCGLVNTTNTENTFKFHSILYIILIYIFIHFKYIISFLNDPTIDLQSCFSHLLSARLIVGVVRG